MGTTKRQRERQTDKEKNKQTKIERQTDKERDKQTKRETNRQWERQTDKEKDKQRDKQTMGTTKRQRERQTDKEKDKHRKGILDDSPLPDGPTRATILPPGISRLKSFRTPWTTTDAFNSSLKL